MIANLFAIGWEMDDKWGFMWRIGFSGVAIWSMCVRFEEVMLCWTYFIALIRRACSVETPDAERPTDFAKAHTVISHIKMCVESWANLEESHKQLPEFDLTSIVMWKHICIALCHLLLLKDEPNVQSVHILRKISDAMMFVSIDAVHRGVAGNFCDAR